MEFSLVQNQKVICFKHYTLETARDISLNWLILFQNLVDFNIKVNHSSCWFVAMATGKRLLAGFAENELRRF